VSERKDLSGIIMTFIMMIVGLALTPTVQELVANSLSNALGNLSGAAAAIVTLVPLFWVILVIGIGLASIVVWLRN
jgi:hypothetical protein